MFELTMYYHGPYGIPLGRDMVWPSLVFYSPQVYNSRSSYPLWVGKTGVVFSSLENLNFDLESKAEEIISQGIDVDGNGQYILNSSSGFSVSVRGPDLGMFK